MLRKWQLIWIEMNRIEWNGITWSRVGGCWRRWIGDWRRRLVAGNRRRNRDSGRGSGRSRRRWTARNSTAAGRSCTNPAAADCYLPIHYSFYSFYSFKFGVELLPCGYDNYPPGKQFGKEPLQHHGVADIRHLFNSIHIHIQFYSNDNSNGFQWHIPININSIQIQWIEFNSNLVFIQFKVTFIEFNGIYLKMELDCYSIQFKWS